MKRLPKEFYRYFWDTDPSKIRIEKYRIYVAHRLLDWGHGREMRFVLKYCGGTEVMKEILRKRRGLRVRQARFWAELLAVPLNEVESLKPEYHTTWKY